MEDVKIGDIVYLKNYKYCKILSMFKYNKTQHIKFQPLDNCDSIVLSKDKLLSLIETKTK